MAGAFEVWILLGIFILQVTAKERLLCDTQRCIDESERLKEYIDDKVNPCEDFHKFACGKFLRNADVPNTETFVSSVTKIKDIVTQQLKYVLVDAPSLPTEPKYVTMTKDLYHTCMKEDMGNKSVQLLLDMIKHAGGFPLLDKDGWDKKNYDWMDAVLKFHEMGFRQPHIFTFDVVENFEKENSHIIKIDEANIEMDQEFLAEGPKSGEIESYVFYLVELTTSLGVQEAMVKQEMSDLLYFEIELARILTEGKERNILPPSMTLEQLKQRHDVINWDKYLSFMLGNDAKLKKDEEIIVNKIDYIRKLEEILKKTEKRTIANFLVLRAIREVARFLTPKIRKLNFDFTRMYHGRGSPLPKWKECMAYTEENLDLAVGSLYVPRYITKEAKGHVTAIAERVQIELKEILNNADWLDEETRSKALSKLKKLKKFVAYPKEILEKKYLEEFYSEVVPHLEKKDTWLEKHLELAKFNSKLQVRKLRQPVKKHDWTTRGGIARVKVGMNYVDNALYVSSGIMQEAFFSEYRPRYLNFGAMGTKIGHEMIHGFDYKGQHYDERGAFKEWWNKETMYKFMQKTKCVFNEAANFTAMGTNLTIDAKNTLRENVADFGGIGLAYKAYQVWANEINVDHIKLFGFEQYTSEQMFWISAANTLCTKYNHDRLVAEIKYGEQSTPDYRINVVFRNFKKFADDFQCSTGDYMNPKEKCDPWSFA